MGLTYEHGSGVTKNIKTPLKLYHAAAKQNQTIAQHTLGVMYATGRGASQDYTLAYMWLYISAANGNVEAYQKCQYFEKNVLSADKVLEAGGLAEKWIRENIIKRQTSSIN